VDGILCGFLILTLHGKIFGTLLSRGSSCYLNLDEEDLISASILAIA
jgi:hypothetical protein